MTNTKELIELVDKTIATYAYHGTSDYMVVDDGKARQTLLDRIEALSAEVERLTNNFKVNLNALHKAANERDQLRAQLEAQGEAVELIVNGRNVFDIDPSFVWSFLKLRSEFDAELMKAAWDALVLAAKATLSQHPAATHPAPAAPVAVLNRPDIVSYVSRYGGMCRDCADENGVCPNSGLTCASNKGIEHVLKALDYGLKHGYITAAIHPTQPKGEKA